MIREKLIIDARNLNFSFEKSNALRDVSIEMPGGTIFGFLGPNGAGKTTTIKVLLGLLQPTKGSAVVMGYNTVTGSESIRASSGVLLEHNGLYEMLSAEENLEYFARIWALSANERKTRIRELLTHIGLWDRRREKVGNWSKGMKQKLAVIRCLLHRPKLIFLDEPTSGLDPAASASLRNDLLGLVKQEGVSIFLTTHNLDEVEKICDAAGVINKGQLLAMGSLAELKRSNESNKTYKITCSQLSETVMSKIKSACKITICNPSAFEVEVEKPESISGVVQTLLDLGVEITTVNETQKSLEEIYLSILK